MGVRATATVVALVLSAGVIRAETSGIDIYMNGTGLSVKLGNAGREAPGQGFPCANCHGKDGLGRSEGATRIPPIRWDRLARASDQRPAYDLAAFARALREGVDPAGRPLAKAMPRYTVSEQDLSAVVHALGELRVLDAHGILADRVLITVPPDDPTANGFSFAVARFNAAGGAFGRIMAVTFDQDDSVADYAALDLLITDNRRSWEEVALMSAIRAAGTSTIRWTSRLSPEERAFRLSRFGLRESSSAPTMLMTESASAQDAIAADAIFASFAEVARDSRVLLDSGAELKLMAPAPEIVDAALSSDDPAAFIKGAIAGEALGQALLATGRTLGRARLETELGRIDWGAILTLQSGRG